MAGSRQDPFEVGSDMDEDEALRYAIALSLQEQELQGEQSSQIPCASTSTSRRNGDGSGGAGLGLLSLDRKKMEEERLQRLAKRRRSPTDEDVTEVPPPKRVTPCVEPPRTVAGSLPASLLPYPKGAIKRTWAYGYPRTPEDIKIEEVFQKDKLELALLSSYQWDDEWLVSKFDLRKTKLLLLAFADSEAQKSEMRSNAPPGIKFVFPAMNGPGAMHSKLQLLKYPDYLRVVVPSANLVPYDWGETGVMENMVFLIDLPRLDGSATHRPTPFSIELGRFLSATGVGETMVNSLTNYDFSQTKHLGFVYTIPGGHQGDELKRIGDDGLAEFKSRTGRAGAAGKNKASNPWQGKLRDRFRIYFPTNETVTRSRGGRNAAGTICVQPKWWRSPTFPTELVRDCVNTRHGLLMHSKMILVSQTEAGSQNQSQLQTRPQTRREPRGHDQGSASTQRDPKTANKSLGWVYVGSANLSESACSTVSASFSEGASASTKVKAAAAAETTAQAQTQARSLVQTGKTLRQPDKGRDTSQQDHVERQKQSKSEQQQQKQTDHLENTDVDVDVDVEMDMEMVLEGTVPIPMQRPGRRYREDEEPWFYSMQE
ncbi:hypothetical protein FPSE_08715 [Fusarium pseudograminearum CS3096]|uniref:PLD phosphodiesterase domain-containing protein n=1 Tax=Fusarium pseudograminearum (strain CS3096) TaxID=1028729 RepID=K3VC56_FUSPC|nr:hypothetical protein FPSE_08715 [Fusarium pseudograminearum CS3096]EKJ71209.1 hypothetical protein FPSE_08715 [Fusarium pseudograminearum CS3096]